MGDVYTNSSPIRSNITLALCIYQRICRPRYECVSQITPIRIRIIPHHTRQSNEQQPTICPHSLHDAQAARAAEVCLICQSSPKHGRQDRPPETGARQPGQDRGHPLRVGRRGLIHLFPVTSCDNLAAYLPKGKREGYLMCMRRGPVLLSHLPTDNQPS